MRHVTRREMCVGMPHPALARNTPARRMWARSAQVPRQGTRACYRGWMRTFRALAAEHFGGLPARFWWLWAGAVVSAFGTFVFLFLAVYLSSRGFSARSVGLVVSADGLGSLAAAPLGGWLA